jgi:hypothetical protein
MYCNLNTGVHTLCLENLDTNSRFELAHFNVDRAPVNKNLLKSNGARIEWRFIVDNLLTTHQPQPHNLTIDLARVSRPTPLAQPPERPRKVVQSKKYETYAPLVQRMRQLNTKK